MSIVVSIIGELLDQPANRHRPTVCVATHKPWTTYILLWNSMTSDYWSKSPKNSPSWHGQIPSAPRLKPQELLENVTNAIHDKCPGATIVHHDLKLKNPWNLEVVFNNLLLFAENTLKPLWKQENEPELFIHTATGTHIEQICLFLLTESGHLPGKLLMSIPPAKNKQTGSCREIDLTEKNYQLIKQRFLPKQDTCGKLKDGIDTKNQAFNKLIQNIEKVFTKIKSIRPEARINYPVLLTGPTGSGKSKLAHKIFELLSTPPSPVTGSFVTLNCAMLRGNLIQSELFGHKKGAFTGATQDRQGKLMAANNGILFLDEVGELDMETQAMLLLALETHNFTPLGSEEQVTSNFMLICGTNKNLEEHVENGTFRRDLLNRINLWTFTLPGLAQRPEDIEPNLTFELNKLKLDFGYNVEFTHEAKTAFLNFARNHPWNGNFREFHALIARLALRATDAKITLDTLQEELNSQSQPEQPHVHLPAHIVESTPDDQHLLLNLLGESAEKLDSFEIPQLAHVIRTCKQSTTLSQAGRTLFHVSRQHKTTSNDADRLARYLKKHGITFEQIKYATLNCHDADVLSSTDESLHTQ